MRVVTILFFLSTIYASRPPAAVGEELNEHHNQPSGTGVRNPRHPFSKQNPKTRIYPQQDQQRRRYLQQQAVDSYVQAYRHLKTSGSAAAAPIFTSPPKSDVGQRDLKPKKNATYRTIEDEIAAASAKRIGRRSPYDSRPDYLAVQAQPPRPAVDPKLVNYEAYVQSFPGERTKGQATKGAVDDAYAQQFVVDPKQLSQLISDKGNGDDDDGGGYMIVVDNGKGELEALNALVGKTPTVQLEGLNQLLGREAHYTQYAYPSQVSQPQPFQVEKDHVPITEDVQDVPNPATRPNIKVEGEEEEQQQQQQHLQTQQAPESHQFHVQNHNAAAADESKGEYGEDLQYASKYAFGYRVHDPHSGNDFGHEEIKDGDVTKGRYYVLLPDGTTQNVNYWADTSGYHAKVTYAHSHTHV